MNLEPCNRTVLVLWILNTVGFLSFRLVNCSSLHFTCKSFLRFQQRLMSAPTSSQTCYFDLTEPQAYYLSLTSSDWDNNSFKPLLLSYAFKSSTYRDIKHVSFWLFEKNCDSIGLQDENCPARCTLRGMREPICDFPSGHKRK